MRAAIGLAGLSLVIAAPGLSQDVRGPATRLDEIGPALRACWIVPRQLGGAKAAEVTVRFALRADGSLLGEPRVTAAGGLPEGPERTLLVASAVRAIRRCTPLPMSADLGRAIAGRVFSLRFRQSGTLEEGESNHVRP